MSGGTRYIKLKMCEDNGSELTVWQEIYHCWSVYIRPYGDGYSRESTPFGRIDYLLNNFTVLWVGFCKIICLYVAVKVFAR